MDLSEAFLEMREKSVAVTIRVRQERSCTRGSTDARTIITLSKSVTAHFSRLDSMIYLRSST
ncbi:hypothetical protein GV67_10800 [Pseudorhizobium pelagicum]|uniref:Uncharacterized protein n=1 Tax=Pseudorhizobium pelagicum TaxID=1509405 RepID=A0A922NY55_9HYPH|nr:hypothetical protein GV68_20445 [Pseudorhizobium pelagicum]KEQ04171.1 hypothetical protein GV67_10800 [Pseudorhizobium pelagicum]